MDLAVEREGTTVYLAPRGRLDIVAADEFRGAYLPILEEGARYVVVDLSGLQYMDSTGMGSLLGLVKRAEAAGGAVRIYGTPAPVRSIFELTRLDLILSLHDTREDAIAALPAESRAHG